MTDRLTPKPSTLVIATYRAQRLIRVHRWPEVHHPDETGDPYLYDSERAACGQTFRNRDRDWWWIRFDLLNPEKVELCKRGCWREGEQP